MVMKILQVFLLEKYYILLVEIKDLIQYLIINLFFDQPVTNKQDTYEKIYTTGTLLDYLHHQNDYQLIGLYLSRQIFLSKLISQKD